MHNKMLRRARWLAPLMALLLLAGLVGQGNAHDSEFHATAVAEGGSTKVFYDPPGGEPPQEFWKDAAVMIKHRYDPATGLNYYRGSFKVNSWKGVFSEDDTIAAPGDPMAVDYQIKIGLLLYDQDTHALTPLSTYDHFQTNGNGWSYGCQGDGRETRVDPVPGKMVVADLRVFGQQKFFHPGGLYWASIPGTFSTHQTRSYRLGTVWVPASPSMLGHGFETDPMSGYFLSQSGSSPQSVWRGYCPLWTTVE